MSKQTVKTRAKLKNSSLRRKTPARPPVTSAPQFTCAVDALERQRNAYVYREPEHGPREMISPDIGCFPWFPPGSVRINRALIPEHWPGKPSLFSRLKAWWRR